MKKQIISLLLLIATQAVYSQLYVPIDTANLPIRTQEGKNYMNFSQEFVKGLKSELSGGEYSYIKKKFKRLDKTINEDLLKGEYVFDSRFDKMIHKIVDEICSKNPAVPTDMKFYVSKDCALNASSLGNKCFVVNMGTFYYLENENQLAAIISHEIAHFVLRHMVLTEIHDYRTDKSGDLRDEVYNIENERYNKGEKAYQKLKEILYENGRLSKKQEFEADSMGYVLYRNTRFDKSDYLTSLRLLEAYDTIRPVGVKAETYKTIFKTPEQPFREEWLKKEDFSGYDYSKYVNRYNEDSLRSHPEIEKRIAAIRTIFPDIDKEEYHEGSSEFQALQSVAKNEQFPNLMFDEEYGIGMYLSLLRLQQDAKDIYSEQWLGRFLQKIYQARKEYTLNRYLERLDPKNQSESYQQFLSFMWNLNLKELNTFAEYYTKKDSK